MAAAARKPGAGGRTIPLARFALAGLALGGCAGFAARITAATPVRACRDGFSGTFIQLGARELTHDRAAWAKDLGWLRSVGVDLVIVQFTGDADGPFDRRSSARPVASLLAAADDASMAVWLGLHLDPRWPHRFPVGEALPPPLDDDQTADALAALCSRHRSCRGWYVPQEIDEVTWGEPERAFRLGRYLARTTAALRRRAPGRPVAVAPFFSRGSDPFDYARFWGTLLDEATVDVIMVQDGVGAGHGTPERAARHLIALSELLDARGPVSRPELWSVVELFVQRHGPPRDELPFAAEPAAFTMVRRSLELEGPFATRRVAFAALSYMRPDGGNAAARLHHDYVAWCEARERR